MQSETTWSLARYCSAVDVSPDQLFRGAEGFVAYPASSIRAASHIVEDIRPPGVVVGPERIRDIPAVEANAIGCGVKPEFQNAGAGAGSVSCDTPQSLVSTIGNRKDQGTIGSRDAGIYLALFGQT